MPLVHRGSYQGRSPRRGEQRGDLRRWFHANPTAWEEFRTRYRAELGQRVDLFRQLADYAQEYVVTLLYASKDEEHNNAAVLREYLAERLRNKETGR